MSKQKFFLGAIGAAALSLSVGAMIAYAITEVPLNTLPTVTAEKKYSDAIKVCSNAFNDSMGAKDDITKPNGIYVKAIADAKATYALKTKAVSDAQAAYNTYINGHAPNQRDASQVATLLGNIASAKALLPEASATLTAANLAAKNAFDIAKAPKFATLTTCKNRLDAPTTATPPGLYSTYKKAVSDAQVQLKKDQTTVMNIFTNAKTAATNTFVNAL